MVAILLAGRPSGPVGGAVSDWLESRQTHALVRDAWQALSTGGGKIGEDDAPAMLIEFMDYRCVYCRAAHDTLAAVLHTQPAGSAVVRQLPRLGDPISRGAALSAICADAQGYFASMHSILLTTEDWIASEDWQALAARAGVPNLKQFTSCLESHEASEAISQDSSWARRLAIKGTPAFLQRSGRVHTGIADRSMMDRWLSLGRDPVHDQ